ncbi:MAG: hypothetical protein ACTHKT_12695 [Solirubrobacterales bacterium]
MAVLLGVLGAILVAPALQSPPAPAHPWALWVGTDARDGRAFPLPASWLLRLWVDADEGCEQPVTVRGELQISQAYKLARSPRLLVLSVAGAHVYGAEVKGILTLRAGPEPRWRRAPISRRGGGYAIQARLRNRIEPDLWVGRVLLFRFRVDAGREVGHESCSITSPALFGSAGENQLWYQAGAAGEVLLRKRGPVIKPVMDDAIVQMAVPDRVPDRSELDAGAKVHGASLLLTCEDGFAHFPPRTAREDDFFTMRTLAEQPSCAGVQTFRAPDAPEDLNRRLFLAGALISTAVALLLASIGPTSRRRRKEARPSV